MTTVDILHVSMGNFISSIAPFNELSFLYSEQALRHKRYHVDSMRRKEDLESFKFYLTVLPKSKGALISLTLT